MKRMSKQPAFKQVPITYNNLWELVDIPTSSTDWYPMYLKYALEYLDIPLTPKLRIKFTDCLVVFDDFLREASNK